MTATPTPDDGALAIPCPFCGGTKIDVREASTFRWRVAFCGECGAVGPEIRCQTMGDGAPEQWEAQARIDAIKEWNTRSPAPVSGEAWLPIESAPKDTPILLFRNIFGDGCFAVGVVHSDTGYTEGYSMPFGLLVAGATHWQPLPAPPTQHCAGAGREGV